MAGSEKICEFSSDYEGYEMYKSKRNHIQVLSKYRKHFRGEKATLYIFENGLKEVWKSGALSDATMECVNPNPTEENWNNHEYFRVATRTPWGKNECFGVFFDNINEYKAALKQYHQRLVMEYNYVLHVPTVPGKVHGLYTNSTHDLTAMKRRIKRMIGSGNLTIKMVRGESMYNFLDMMYLTLKDCHERD